jgi:hypothetical protein
VWLGGSLLSRFIWVSMAPYLKVRCPLNFLVERWRTSKGTGCRSCMLSCIIPLGPGWRVALGLRVRLVLRCVKLYLRFENLKKILLKFRKSKFLRNIVVWNTRVKIVQSCNMYVPSYEISQIGLLCPHTSFTTSFIKAVRPAIAVSTLDGSLAFTPSISAFIACVSSCFCK